MNTAELLLGLAYIGGLLGAAAFFFSKVRSGLISAPSH